MNVQSKDVTLVKLGVGACESIFVKIDVGGETMVLLPQIVSTDCAQSCLCLSSITSPGWQLTIFSKVDYFFHPLDKG